MVVRVKIKIICKDKLVETIGLLNSGYESETPQILIPVELAKVIGLWPDLENAEETEFETAGGPLKVWIIPRACRVTVLTEDTHSPEIEGDIVISPMADEVLISDKMISELLIVLEDVGRGLWRFRWEPPEKLRRGYPPKYWK